MKVVLHIINQKSKNVLVVQLKMKDTKKMTFQIKNVMMNVQMDIQFI